MSEGKRTPLTLPALCLLFAISATVTGCRKSSSPQKTPEISTEVDVAFAYLSDHYNSSNTPLVIHDTFSLGTLNLYSETQGKIDQYIKNHASEEIPADLIQDFCAKNADRKKVWPELPKHSNVVCLSSNEFQSLYVQKDGEKSDFWDKFYKRYPKAPGVIWLSRVGLNRRGDMAMIYVESQSSWHVGGERFYIFRKQGNKWVETKISIGPSRPS